MIGQLSFDFTARTVPVSGRNSPLSVPDFSRVFYVFRKDKKGFTEMFEFDGKGKTYSRAEWLEFCDRHRFVRWSYLPYIGGQNG